jgi:hypothetical protein
VTGNADGLRLAFETWGRGARFGAMPIRAGHAVYWFATANAAEGATDKGARAALESRFGTWHAPILELLAATDDTALVRTDIYDPPRTATWTSGRITLLATPRTRWLPTSARVHPRPWRTPRRSPRT